MALNPITIKKRVIQILMIIKVRMRTEIYKKTTKVILMARKFKVQTINLKVSNKKVR